MDDSNFKIEEVFDSAVNIVRNLPKEGPIKPSDELKLKLYAYFKQATHGPNDTPKPRFYQIVEAYKWDAWGKLGEMSKEDAMLEYIRELKKIMDTIPKEETDLDETKHFEDVLGKKFYDYCKFIVSPSMIYQNMGYETPLAEATRFNQWHQGGQHKSKTSSGELIASTYPEQAGRSSTIRGNDNQNDSSSGSSVSMLEDTNSAGGDGYKTPTSMAHNITNQMSDQFALAILRLQHGLDETRKQFIYLEGQLKSSMDRIERLENQTYAKKSSSAAGSGNNSRRGVNPSSGNCMNLVSKFMNSFGERSLFHLFYLTYPILIYALLHTLQRRGKKSAPR